MNKKLRVLHLACVAPPEVGGIGMSALREVEGLRVRGHEAVLATPEMGTGEQGVERPAGVRALKPLWRVGNAASLPLESLLSEGWDVVHLHYPFYGTAEMLLLRTKHIPIVLTFHMDAEMIGWREPIARIHRLLIQPGLLQKAKKIFVTSLDYARNSSITSLVRRQDQRLVELPFGIDLTQFQPGPSEREYFSLPTDGTIFLMVGGLDRAHAFKGVSIALQAFAKLSSKNAYLALRGEGDLKRSFQDLAKALGVAERVIFLPRCATADLPRLYRSADILLFPSISKAEAFGLVAIEAQACGTPVIVSALPGVRSVLEQGKTGWIVPVKDVAALQQAMQEAIDQPELVKEYGRNGVERVSKLYDQEQHLDRLIEAYQSVCGSPS